MVEVLGKFGVVHRITNNGDIRVQYPGNPEQNFRWTLNPAALSRVDKIKMLLSFRIQLIKNMLLKGNGIFTRRLCSNTR